MASVRRESAPKPSFQELKQWADQQSPDSQPTRVVRAERYRDIRPEGPVLAQDALPRFNLDFERRAPAPKRDERNVVRLDPFGLNPKSMGILEAYDYQMAKNNRARQMWMDDEVERARAKSPRGILDAWGDFADKRYQDDMQWWQELQRDPLRDLNLDERGNPMYQRQPPVPVSVRTRQWEGISTAPPYTFEYDDINLGSVRDIADYGRYDGTPYYTHVRPPATYANRNLLNVNGSLPLYWGGLDNGWMPMETVRGPR